MSPGHSGDDDNREDLSNLVQNIITGSGSGGSFSTFENSPLVTTNGQLEMTVKEKVDRKSDPGSQRSSMKLADIENKRKSDPLIQKIQYQELAFSLGDEGKDSAKSKQTEESEEDGDEYIM